MAISQEQLQQIMQAALAAVGTQTQAANNGTRSRVKAPERPNAINATKR